MAVPIVQRHRGLRKVPSRWKQYLPLLQGDLALLFTADESPVTPEHPVASAHKMSKGCREETDPVLDYPLQKKKKKTPQP